MYYEMTINNKKIVNIKLITLCRCVERETRIKEERKKKYGSP